MPSSTEHVPSSSTDHIPPGDIAAPPRQQAAPRSRTGATWIGICVAALLLVVLTVFMLQNTSDVEVSFLGWQGSVPLALALLTAAVGTAILTMAIGTARIAQLRRINRGH